jgi:hypothetical protein
MSVTTVIALNAVLDAAVVTGLFAVLIRPFRLAQGGVVVVPVSRDEDLSLAA